MKLIVLCSIAIIICIIIVTINTIAENKILFLLLAGGIIFVTLIVNKTQKHKFAWMIPCLLGIGYLATYPKIEGFEIHYFALTIVSVISCWLLISCLSSPPLIDTLPIWVLVLSLILYYIHFYWIVYDPEIADNLWFPLFRWLAHSPSALLKTYATITYAFSTICVTACILVGHSGSTQRGFARRKVNYIDVTPVLLCLIPILMGVTFYVMYMTGISRMAAESIYLPFRMAGWIFYVRTMLIPCLILLFIWCSEKSGLNKYVILGIALLIIHGTSEMLLRSSRGALLGFFIALAIFFVTTGSMNKRRLRLIAVIFLITIVSFPVISSYRLFRTGSYPTPIAPALQQATESFSEETSRFAENLELGILSILFRSGTSSLLPIVGLNIQPLAERIFELPVTRFFTVDVMGYSPYHIHGSAPSLIGWFYLVGGNYFVVIGIFIYTFLTWICWRVLASARLLSLPVAQALFLYSLLNISIEGTLEGLFLRMIVLTGSIVVAESIIRLTGGTPIIAEK